MTFWVGLKAEADVTSAHKAKGKTAKARAVLETKTAFAKKSQAGVIALAKDAGARYKSFWIANTVQITGDKALAEKIAARSDVATIEADDPVTIPDPLPGTGEPEVDAVEWNIDRINAPKVWSGFGVKGEGIVVANIDSGVQFDHPALQAAYRGTKADGTYSHDYNWFDPASVCATAAPCDNNGHGTHTMGTMVGADGIGVAPGAKWIAAKGCATSSCARDTLLASGQWVVAPTDSIGANPRPELAPDVVNNSWGANVYDAWYRDTVQSWRDSRHLPGLLQRQQRPQLHHLGQPRLVHQLLLLGRVRHQQRHRLLLRPRNRRERGDQARPRGAGSQRPLLLGGRRLQHDLRYVDGLPAHRGDRRPDVGGLARHRR